MKMSEITKLEKTEAALELFMKKWIKSQEKLEAIKSKLAEIRDDEIWTELPEIELAEELLKILEDSEFNKKGEE